LHEIGWAFDRNHMSIHFLLTQNGGIVPAVRRRSLLTLTLAEPENSRWTKSSPSGQCCTVLHLAAMR
jgi:hypothetical protein